MFFEDPKTRNTAAKWVISVVGACVLIYVLVRHIYVVPLIFSWVTDIILPLIIGVAAAVILNVPMSFIERNFFPKAKKRFLKKIRRPVAIILSIILVVGIFTGVAFLVVPELVNAAGVISTNIMGAVDYLAKLDASGAVSEIPFSEYIDRLDIDWDSLRKDVENWIKNISTKFMGTAINTVGNVVGGVANAIIGFVFAIYVLANKEYLKHIAARLLCAWFPQKTAKGIIHIASVCSDVLKKFISAQTVEAIILGSLCSLGMAILQLPYATMIGALVGVTALIPVIGAFIGTIIGAFMIITISPFKALVFVIFLLILQQIEGNFIYPRVVGASINLPAMWVLAAVTIGGNLGGALGLFLGVPAVSAAYLLFKEATAKREKAKAKALSEKYTAHEEDTENDIAETEKNESDTAKITED